MKDPHDRGTQDFGTLDPSFVQRPLRRHRRASPIAVTAEMQDSIDSYLHEKPYLREALRRTGK